MDTKLKDLKLALRDVESAIQRHKNDDENNVMSDLLKEKKLLLDELKKHEEIKHGKW